MKLTRTSLLIIGTIAALLDLPLASAQETQIDLYATPVGGWPSIESLLNHVSNFDANDFEDENGELDPIAAYASFSQDLVCTHPLLQKNELALRRMLRSTQRELNEYSEAEKLTTKNAKEANLITSGGMALEMMAMGNFVGALKAGKAAGITTAVGLNLRLHHIVGGLLGAAVGHVALSAMDVVQLTENPDYSGRMTLSSLALPKTGNGLDISATALRDGVAQAYGQRHYPQDDSQFAEAGWLIAPGLPVDSLSIDPKQFVGSMTRISKAYRKAYDELEAQEKNVNQSAQDILHRPGGVMDRVFVGIFSTVRLSTLDGIYKARAELYKSQVTAVTECFIDLMILCDAAEDDPTLLAN